MLADDRVAAAVATSQLLHRQADTLTARLRELMQNLMSRVARNLAGC